MRVLNQKETRLVVATLSAIDNERRRCYWNNGCGDYVEVADGWTLSKLADMLEDCVGVIRRDFGE